MEGDKDIVLPSITIFHLTGDKGVITLFLQPQPQLCIITLNLSETYNIPSTFKPLVKKGKTIAVPIQKFDVGAGFVQENEHIARNGVFFQVVPHDSGQSVELKSRSRSRMIIGLFCL